MYVTNSFKLSWFLNFNNSMVHTLEQIINYYGTKINFENLTGELSGPKLKINGNLLSQRCLIAVDICPCP
jgi:carbohydrate-binding DOMON domain-containing protein